VLVNKHAEHAKPHFSLTIISSLTISENVAN